MKTNLFRAARMAAAGLAAYMLTMGTHGVHKPVVSPDTGLHKNYSDCAEAEFNIPSVEPEMTLEEFCTAFANMQDEKFAQLLHNATVSNDFLN